MYLFALKYCYLLQYQSTHYTKQNKLSCTLLLHSKLQQSYCNSGNLKVMQEDKYLKPEE